MIRKLQIKFVMAAVLSVLTVLTVILGAIHILNYKKIAEEADTLLEILEENQGVFPLDIRKPEPGKRPEAFHENFSPEIPYESRYFTVELDAQGKVSKVDVDRIAAVDETAAEEYAEKVRQSPKEKGFIRNYRYRKEEHGQGLRVTFLDCGRSLSTFRSFLATSVKASALGLTAVLILVGALSKKIVKPFAQSYEKQKRFITDAGHEIKTPLTVIDADLVLVEMETGQNEWLDDIQKQTKRLKELTNDLIYLSRLEENQEKLPMIDFPISDVVLETAQSFQSLAKTQKKSFDVQVEPMLTCRGDEASIRRLVSILLDNACKYSSEGGRISLTFGRRGKALCLTVFNTAEAVSGDGLERLFDRFYRSDHSRNSQTGGYGIGLAIAKAIVQAHRGKITASSQDGRSLLITVTL